jgi:2,3-bisphosphoglycerate-dependent phosphoglycerate mutase
VKDLLRKEQGARNKGGETRNKGQGTRNKKQGTRDKKQETRNKKQETRNKGQETRNKEQGTRNKKQGTRDKKQETRNKEQGTSNKDIPCLLSLVPFLPYLHKKRSMKKILLLLLVMVCLVVGSKAQTSTYILLRHAEKETTGQDPALTPAGEQRAQKLLEVLKEYNPDVIYSSNYLRTRSTVTPLAKKSGKEIQLYNPGKLAEFAAQLLEIKGKTVIVAGHSNTTPALANLLLKEKTYPDLDDSVYNQFWIITVVDGKATAKVVTY